MERYINPEILYTLNRPQRKKLCSITSIASCLNYFGTKLNIEQLNDISCKKIITDLDFDLRDYEKGPGNRDMEELINKSNIKYGLNLDAIILFKDGWELNSPKNDDYWNELKQILIEDYYCIIHIEGHYAPVLGYANFPKDPDSNIADDNRWLLIADPSPFHRQSQKKSQHYKYSPPVWSISWGAVRDQIYDNKPYYGIIVIRNENFDKY